MNKYKEETSYTVWVGGTEVNDKLLTKEQAEELLQEYKDKGYDDAVIDNYAWEDK